MPEIPITLLPVRMLATRLGLTQDAIRKRIAKLKIPTWQEPEHPRRLCIHECYLPLLERNEVFKP